MSEDKLRNLAKVPGMSELIGSLGIEVLNDIADRYSAMYEAAKKFKEIWEDGPCGLEDFKDVYFDFVSALALVEEAT